MPPNVSWLLLEGLLPLFGAGVIYLVWGVCRYAATMERSAFTYRWGEAGDPLGWLYGAIIIAAQTAVRDFTLLSNGGLLGWLCIAAAAFCLLLLVAAMTDRGAASSWKPTLVFQLLTIAVVGAILCLGCVSHMSTPR